jgi:hypothetical protein
MTRTDGLAPAMPGSNGQLGALIATDRRYFEAGAVNERIGHATVSWVPGLTHLAAGCVVHSVETARITDPQRWLDAVESTCRTRGARLFRLYVEEDDQLLRNQFVARGLVPRVEHAFVASLPSDEPSRDVVLEPLPPDDDDGWGIVEGLHRRTGIGSGIHAAPADAWTRLMRLRCASDEMAAYLLRVDGRPLGSVGVLAIDGMVRSKNLLVERRSRRRAIGRSALALVGRIGGARACGSIGAFAVGGTDGYGLYRATGFAEVGAQVEWSKPRA